MASLLCLVVLGDESNCPDYGGYTTVGCGWNQSGSNPCEGLWPCECDFHGNCTYAAHSYPTLWSNFLEGGNCCVYKQLKPCIWAMNCVLIEGLMCDTMVDCEVDMGTEDYPIAWAYEYSVTTDPCDEEEYCTPPV